ncbi:Signal transducer regulating beta-lactamase production, contains metallopeptidase domain [Sphingomonas laterariae]|uniref:Signal transducer regulating beta-lactamase production, contains metallopeptidase domain n=1 Tax=Edaphosphingomonas laterariae TaxID=861865 RepID=A0A239CM18_9SPHN|nr:M56 family metallopeptidase [Sphingomonas laterariae]SNS21286.1 Signal transducer regulating beta-lactamase production, contains metallopeptidase domain [Sphingomonas laterariae]
MSADWLSASRVAEALIASGLLMAVVLLVRGRVARAFGARVAYALWALPVLRLVMPPLPEMAEPVAAQVPIRIDLSMLDHAVAAPMPVASMDPLPVPGPDWLAIGLGIWLAGAVLYFGWQIGLYRHFLRMALRGSAFLCRRCGIAVHVSAGVRGPVAAGILARRILLPGDFTRRYSRQEQRLVIAHEVAHHVRGDLIANLVALVLVSLHWFNPLAHIAYRAFRADQELACDETVLADEPTSERHAYATALVKSAGHATPAAACALGATQIKRRLKMMAAAKRSRVRRLAGSALVGLLVGGGLMLTATGGIAASGAVEMPRLALVDPVAALPAVQPVPVAPSAVAVEAPTAPVAPVAPAAPVAPVAVQAAAEADRVAAVAEARAAAAEAVAQARESIATARVAEREARASAQQARAQAMRALANVDVDSEVRAAFAAARLDMERGCSERARRDAAGLDDRAAITALSRNCVDMRAIRSQVADALRDARADIRAADLPDAQRRRVTAALDAEIARLRGGGLVD